MLVLEFQPFLPYSSSRWHHQYQLLIFFFSNQVLLPFHLFQLHSHLFLSCLVSLVMMLCRGGGGPYIVWRSEVRYLMTMTELTDAHRFQALRSSLRGSTRLTTLLHGLLAALIDVLSKSDTVFSYASSKEDLISEFLILRNTVRSQLPLMLVGLNFASVYYW